VWIGIGVWVGGLDSVYVWIWIWIWVHWWLFLSFYFSFLLLSKYRQPAAFLLYRFCQNDILALNY